jgi:ubiquinone/menaquinone biosynthesis C-methylase UbiE
VGFTNRLWRVYWKLERRIAPGVRYAQTDFEECLFSIARSGDDWLDIGCGHSLLPEWRASQERDLIRLPRKLIGLDPVRSALLQHRSIALLVCGDAGHLPFPDGTFDLVTANMVVEHLADPQNQFREISRILKVGGRFVFHTPNATGYPTLMARLFPDKIRGLAARILENRAAGDRFGTYYRANTPARISRMSQQSGFLVERIELLRSTAMFWMIAPLAAAELVFLRALAGPKLSRLRPNLIAVLRKTR